MTSPNLNIAGLTGFDSAQSKAADAARRNVEQKLAFAGDDPMRDRIGEIVGQIFYGTLIKEMHASKIKGKYLHGGRGEEIFQGQLGMELAMRAGRAPNSAIADRLYESMAKRLGRKWTTDSTDPAGSTDSVGKDAAVGKDVAIGKDAASADTETPE